MKHLTKEHKQNIGKANSVALKEYYKNNKGYWLGKKRPEMVGDNNPAKRLKVRKKISKAKKGLKCPQFSGDKHPNWKGGKVKSKGYWHIKKSGHPFAHKNGYILQSHLVAEKCLGRYLTSEEIIHHINEIKDDDNPENLYLFATTNAHTKFHFSKIKPELKSNLEH